MTTRLVSTAAAALLAAGALTACSGGGDSDYCDAVKGANDASITDFTSEDAQEAFDQMADAAPDEISDDWDVLVKAMDALSGGDPGALADADPTKLEEAATNITQYTQDKCDVDLNQG